MERPTNALTRIETRRFPWLEWTLLLAGQALFFQVIPGAWRRVVDSAGWTLHSVWMIVDVRNWTVWGYVIGLSVVLVALVAVKVWKDRD